MFFQLEIGVARYHAMDITLCEADGRRRIATAWQFMRARYNALSRIDDCSRFDFGENAAEDRTPTLTPFGIKLK